MSHAQCDLLFGGCEIRFFARARSNGATFGPWHELGPPLVDISRVCQSVRV